MGCPPPPLHLPSVFLKVLGGTRGDRKGCVCSWEGGAMSEIPGIHLLCHSPLLTPGANSSPNEILKANGGNWPLFLWTTYLSGTFPPPREIGLA